MRQAVILAGGKGTRLASVLNGLPKPLVDVCGKPLLLHQLELLCAHGFTDAAVMVNHRADAIQEWLMGVDLPISVRLIDDGEPRGTAGAVLAALGELEPEFLVMYGDTMLCVDLDAVLGLASRSSRRRCFALSSSERPSARLRPGRNR